MAPYIAMPLSSVISLKISISVFFNRVHYTILCPLFRVETLVRKGNAKVNHNMHRLYLKSLTIQASVIMSLSLLFANPSFCQEAIDYSSNCPRPGDAMKRQVLDYFDAGDSGCDVLWDLQGIKPTGESYDVIFCYNTDTVFIELTEDGMTKYDLNESRLGYIGFETPLMAITYDSPIPAMEYPSFLGAKIEFNYKGKGSYCKTLLIDNVGEMYTEVDATGSIVTYRGDTLRNAIRIHQVQTNSLRLYPQSDTKNLVIDTIPMKQDITDTYRWYVSGCRYPVYETRNQTFYHELEPIATTDFAYCCLPDRQTLINDSINEIRRIETPSPDVKNIMHYTTQFDGNTLTLNYTVDEDAENVIANGAGAVELKRTIKAGVNTIVLPFSMTQEEVEDYFGEGSVVYVADAYTAADENINFNTSTAGIAPNVPVLLKATEAGSEYSIPGRTIVAAEPSYTFTNGTMVGTYTADSEVPTEGLNYVISNNKLYIVNSEITMKATRAYISLDSEEEEGAKVINITFDGGTTGIATVENGEVKVYTGKIFDISGREVKTMTKGIYVVDGKKVMVK